MLFVNRKKVPWGKGASGFREVCDGWWSEGLTFAGWLLTGSLVKDKFGFRARAAGAPEYREAFCLVVWGGEAGQQSWVLGDGGASTGDNESGADTCWRGFDTLFEKVGGSFVARWFC